MTFEEILPRLKAGHTCYRPRSASTHSDIDHYVRRVTGAFGGDIPIGFVLITRIRAMHVGDPAEETFDGWMPTIGDLLATDWNDLDAIPEESVAPGTECDKEPAAS